jgi:flagellar hook-length control protein FliK
MLTSLRGRVESDPMLIPAPLSLSTRPERGFDDVLRQVSRPDEPRVEEAAKEPPPDEAPAAEGAQAPVEERAEREVAERQDEAPVESPSEAGAADDVAAEADVTTSISRGEPVRQETAGKGTDSPRTPSTIAEPLRIAVVQHGAQNVTPQAAVFSGRGQVEAVGAAKSATPMGRGPAGEFATATAGRPAAVAAGYRTAGPSSAQMLEQARDSVFKQILMKLNGDGGEMRLRLEPPDLGELDLRLVVEHGNKLSLTIGAERPDLAQLLQRHLDELKQTLQAAGLEVTSAQVETREHGGSREWRDQPASGGQRSHDDQAESAPQMLRRAGYVTAEGLDFWV